MIAISTMRRVWMAVSLAVALLSLYPALIGRTSWWLPGLAITFFLIFLLEPLLLTWELRKSGDLLQITDEGVLRRLPRGQNEYVRWSDLREVSVVVTQNAGAPEDYFYVLAGSGKSGVLVNQALAAKHDLLSHLAKLPGFDHRGVTEAMTAVGNQRFLLWRAPTLAGVATVIPMNRLEPPPRTLH
ncbi:MAG TPA: hypothetical protein VM146_18280 [Steroidobacteraceae bacterium]|nr:hypothetical protein [Steroidobacteraceae bacterium]